MNQPQLRCGFINAIQLVRVFSFRLRQISKWKGSERVRQVLRHCSRSCPLWFSCRLCCARAMSRRFVECNLLPLCQCWINHNHFVHGIQLVASRLKKENCFHRVVAFAWTINTQHTNYPSKLRVMRTRYFPFSIPDHFVQYPNAHIFNQNLLQHTNIGVSNINGYVCFRFTPLRSMLHMVLFAHRVVI